MHSHTRPTEDTGPTGPNGPPTGHTEPTEPTEHTGPAWSERGVAGRQGLVWPVLAGALQSVRVPGYPVRVLDCGGGSGGFAVPVAESGARVTVVDVSADALATLWRRAQEAGVSARVDAVQGDVESLEEAVPIGSFDLVLAHGILESVDEVPVAFAKISAALRPGGLLSVLVGNPIAAVLSRALSGDLIGALAELRALDDEPRHGDPHAIQSLCRQHGLVIEQIHGIGVFSELVPGSALDLPGALSSLAALEREAATRAPFADIASRVHLLARRPER